MVFFLLKTSVYSQSSTLLNKRMKSYLPCSFKRSIILR